MENLTINAEAPWTTTLFTAQNAQHASIKANLIKHMYAHEKEESTAVASGVAQQIKRNLFESKFNFFDHDLPEVRALQEFCSSITLEVARHHNQGFWTDEMTPAVNCHESWYHITRKGGYHDYHMHPNCSWCGIYYVDIGDAENGNGSNSFLDPRSNTQAYRDYGSLYLQAYDQFEITPAEGMLVVFPSYLYHSARPYEGERDRIVVAFNAVIYAQPA